MLSQNVWAEDFFTAGGPPSMSFAGNGRNDYDPSLSGKDDMVVGSTPVETKVSNPTKFGFLSW